MVCVAVVLDLRLSRCWSFEGSDRRRCRLLWRDAAQPWVAPPASARGRAMAGRDELRCLGWPKTSRTGRKTGTRTRPAPASRPLLAPQGTHTATHAHAPSCMARRSAPRRRVRGQLGRPSVSARLASARASGPCAGARFTAAGSAKKPLARHGSSRCTRRPESPAKLGGALLARTSCPLRRRRPWLALMAPAAA